MDSFPKLLVVGSVARVSLRAGESVDLPPGKSVVLATHVQGDRTRIVAPVSGWVATNSLRPDPTRFMGKDFPTRGSSSELDDPIRDAREMGCDELSGFAMMRSQCARVDGAQRAFSRRCNAWRGTKLGNLLTTSLEMFLRRLACRASSRLTTPRCGAQPLLLTTIALRYC